MNLVEEKRKNNFPMETSKRCANLPKKNGANLNFKKIIDKIHKLIVKELKFNVNHSIKIDENHNLLQV